MKNNSIIIIFQLLLLAFISSCQKSNLNALPNNYFPNRVGDEWVYEVIDTAIQNNNYPAEHYIVKISITGITKLLDGKTATIWQYQYPTGIETNYFRLTGDTIKMFTLYSGTTVEALNYPQMIYIQPFKLNESWRDNFDSSRVFGQADVKTPLKLFQNCFGIFHYYTSPNIFGIDSLWFEPYIGFVSMYYIHHGGGPTIYSLWQLKSYYTH